jgi:uncharacterized damage-inducible protein DinB
MLLETMRTLLAYDHWANGQLFDTVALLDADQYAATGVASFGSVHDTLAHLIYTQRLWLTRAQEVPMPEFHPEAIADCAGLRDEWERVDAATHAYAATLTEPDMARVVRYTNDQGEPNAYLVWHVLFHLVNHAAQHRSEIAAMLTQFGHSPGWFDFLYYLDLRDGTTLHHA